MRFDLVIVGAGMAGATLALALSERGFSVGLVDQAPLLPVSECSTQLSDIDLRVVALTHASVSLLSDIGAWPSIRRLGESRYDRMEVWDADGTASVNFDAREIDAEDLGVLVESRSVVSVLHQQLRQSNVACFVGSGIKSVTRDDESVVVEIDTGQRIVADVLVGADGGNSFIRSQLNTSIHEIDNRQQAIVCNVHTALPHQQVARQRFLSSGPLAFLPLAAVGADVSSIVWSCDNALAEDLMALDSEQFAISLASAFEHRLGDITQVSRRLAFPLVAKHPTSYVAERTVLIGDAAHVIHPLAGQGINLGFGDVSALIDCFSAAAKRKIPISEARVLARYQRMRRAENTRMIAVTQGFKSLFAYRNLWLRWMRNEGMRFVDGTPSLRRAIISRAVFP